MTLSVSVIGTIFVDCKGFAKQGYVPSGRNLGSIEFIHGGVGRNVAENLANLDLPTLFISTVDHSALGEEVLHRLHRSKVDTSYIARAEAQGMGMWLAILDEHGNLAGSVSQMPELEILHNLIIQKGEEIIRDSSHIVLELDLNEDISKKVISLAKQYNKPVYGIPGNLDVVLKHTELLNDLSCFICNHVEAERLIQSDFSTQSLDEMRAALQAYVEAASLRSMVVTLGEQGSIFYDKETKESGYQPIFPAKLVDSSGAGDAFFSGTVMGLINNLSLKEAVICGTKVAGWTIESKENTASELSKKIKDDDFFTSLWIQS